MQLRHSEPTRAAPRLLGLAKYVPPPVWSRELWLTSIRRVVPWDEVLHRFRHVYLWARSECSRAPRACTQVTRYPVSYTHLTLPTKA